MLAFIGMPGHLEMLIIAFVALLLFGNRLPGVMRSLGRGVVEFKHGLHGVDDDDDEEPEPPKKSRKAEKTKVE